MTILHLADLHIGKIVNGFSMLDEQRHAARQILAYVRAEHPGAVLIAGDVYDRASPGTEAVRVFDDLLTDLSREDVPILIVAGNHDSAERLVYASRLLSDQRIFLRGVPDGALTPVTLTDEYGAVHFWLLPFIKPSSVRGLFGEAEPETYDDALAAVLDSADIDYTARNVLVAHQFFTGEGVTPLRFESELNPVGGLDAVNAARLAQFDYAALGHLHGAQTVGAEHIRYAGSPIKYSLSEWRHAKSVTRVELREKGARAISALPFTPLHDMREIKGRLDALTAAGTALRADAEDYLRVILTDEEELVDPMGKLRSVYPNIMSLDFENARTRVDVSGISAEPESIERLSTCDLFSEFFLELSGVTMSEEQTQLARELLEAAAVTE
ncbi:MAG: exonuclease SbcCD subunit D [Oscillospiraceae bacterium]|jgi:exonuclease SbcD|nr:exonuclease SbcCD subunit D [Oscillospiraceae bacterium]